MKTLLKSALTAIRRAAAYWRVRSLEINLQGALDVLPHVRDRDTRDAMTLSINRMRKELVRARGDYQATLPPGRRVTWSVA